MLGFPDGSDGKASVCNAGHLGSIPGSGRSPGEGNGNPLQYSCLENPMDGRAWWATVHGVAKSGTRLSDFTFTSLTCLVPEAGANVLNHKTTLPIRMLISPLRECFRELSSVNIWKILSPMNGSQQALNTCHSGSSLLGDTGDPTSWYSQSRVVLPMWS